MPSPDPQPKPLDHLVNCGKQGAPALVLRDRTLDFEELNDRVGAMSAWLKSKLQHGDRVASWAAKGELTCLLPLAAARAGVIHVPINPLLKRAQAAHILSDCGASMMVGTRTRIQSLEPADAPPGCIILEEAEALDQVRAFEDRLPLSQNDTDELVAILYTSGSTGQPKGVMLSHANLWLGAVSVAHYLELRPDDVTLAVLPLSFDYGQNQLLSSWYAGGSVVPLDYLFPRDVAKNCARHAITTLAAVPPLWVQLSEIDWAAESSEHLRRITNSGGALTVDLIDALRARLPNTSIYPMYGLTEAFRSTYLHPELVAENPTSIGTAIPFAEVLVINDKGQVAGPDEEGELVHCGPLVAKGYWQDEVRTKERFRPAPEQSAYGGMAVWSGDRVFRDSEGLLHFVGRRDAMIKSAGNRISPQEIEDAARATGLVVEAVALGVPDDRLGHEIHLVVRGEAGVSAREDLRSSLAKVLPNFMQPHQVHWRDSMPLNPNGKIDRPRLLAMVSQ